jgi:glycosyltransferase involved in cell wall biosynthesis
LHALKKTDQLRASVCIPTRNRRDLLLKTLASLERQSLGPDQFEVIVVDDGSTDGSGDAIQALRFKFQLQYLRLNHRGAGAARNTAAGMARGETLIFLDDDQLASPGLLAAHLSAQSAAGEALVQGDYPLAKCGRTPGTSLLYERSRQDLWQHPPDGSGLVHIWGANMSVPSRLWALVGGFDETLFRHQDLDFGLRIAARGIPIVFAPEALSHHVHVVDAASFRRQNFTGGRSIAQLSRKHNVSLTEMLGRPTHHRFDQAVGFAWRRSPPVADQLGRWLSGLLGAADRIGMTSIQVAAARLIRRYYVIGGIAVETAASSDERTER